MPPLVKRRYIAPHWLRKRLRHFAEHCLTQIKSSDDLYPDMSYGFTPMIEFKHLSAGSAKLLYGYGPVDVHTDRGWPKYNHFTWIRNPAAVYSVGPHTPVKEWPKWLDAGRQSEGLTLVFDQSLPHQLLEGPMPSVTQDLMWMGLSVDTRTIVDRERLYTFLEGVIDNNCNWTPQSHGIAA